jgi:hypothetical protein
MMHALLAAIRRAQAKFRAAAGTEAHSVCPGDPSGWGVIHEKKGKE